MGSIVLRNVGVVASRPLFQNLTFTLADGDRLGLVAGNGGGKSTLLRCLAGLTEPSHGIITMSRGLRMVLVEQDIPAPLLDLPLADALRRSIPAEEIESQSWRVDFILDELAVPTELHDRPIRQLSGGWQRLALIARAWIAEPDALLLDEPTNHLDLAKIRHLEGWIRKEGVRMPMVIASHDRAFLDNCTTRTLFLRPEQSHLYAHPYSIARDLLKQDDAAEQARTERDGREAARLRRSAAELRNIGINSRSDAAQKKSKQMAQRAKALEETVRSPHRDKAAAVRLATSDTHARVLIALDDVVVRRPNGEPLFRTGKLELKRGDRVLLLGPNGAGKSQFVRMLHRALSNSDGAPGIRNSPTLEMGYLDQLMAHLPDRDTLHGFIAGFDQGDQRTTSLLAGAGFPPDRQHRPLAELSLGERARLGLLALRLREPNFYLLDEPTNHLDIPGQEQLELEILTHEASAILVTHDRRFARAIGTRFLTIARGRLIEADPDDSPWPG
ncbi:MAG TPA: ABC-F family ATP-binding cassette domain-containing protein [Dongiaceae bacterium]|jgi:ATPase subunit of ABC transporter with duplicated ATPase domains